MVKIYNTDIETDKFDEVVNDTFLLSFGDEEDMASLEVDDMRGKLTIIVEFKLVNPQEFSRLSGLSELFSVNGVFVEQPLLVNGFHHGLMRSCKESNLFVGVVSSNKKIVYIVK